MFKNGAYAAKTIKKIANIVRIVSLIFMGICVLGGLIAVIATEGDEEEIQEYFEECYAECDASVTDVIVDYCPKNKPEQVTRIYSQDDQIKSAKLN